MPSLTPADHGRLVFDDDVADMKSDGSTGATGVYWLADANLAATQTFGVSGINPDGSMTWQTALNWVDAMNKVDNGPGQPKGYLGYSNWTLPLTPDQDPTGHAKQHNTGSNEDFGFDFYGSLFGHLFYQEFGGRAGDNIADMNNAATRLFENFQPYYYWGGDFPTNTRAFHLPVDFSFGNGFLGTDITRDFEYVIPEFSADSSDGPVPPPENQTVQLQPIQADPQLVQVPGHKMVYDPNLGNAGVTWLADADLAATNSFGVKGINADGSMTWETAQEWINAMNAADYLGHSDWRMPHSDGEDTQDYYRRDSEMGELFYTELGSQAGSTIGLTHDHEEHLFHNFQPYLYWSDTEVLDSRGDTKTKTHESFSFGNGLRSGNTDPNDLYVIPVFDGPPDRLPGPPDGKVPHPGATTGTRSSPGSPIGDIPMPALAAPLSDHSASTASDSGPSGRDATNGTVVEVAGPSANTGGSDARVVADIASGIAVDTSQRSPMYLDALTGGDEGTDPWSPVGMI